MLLRQVQEDVLHRLGRVGVAARHAVESLLSGQHRSVHRGLSVEFAGHRPYMPGDDLRHLDWQVYARSDRYDIKVFEEETRLSATIIVDYSGSMSYGSAGTSKLDYARMLAATLAFIMVRQGDGVGLVTCDKALRRQLPPGSTMGHLLQILKELEQQEAGGETSLAEVLQDVIPRLRRRSLVILISDCFDHAKPLVQSLQHMRFAGHDVRLFQVVDPKEESFDLRGSWELVGMEGEAPVRLDVDRIRHRYQSTLAAHREAILSGCHAAGVTCNHTTTDADLAMFVVEALTGNGEGPQSQQQSKRRK